ncbi:MAG TPA: hypothetical protein VHS06_03500, partial [Chloroflexota bacterium]|nr:hypothetical protein [Chloroflexota bacterium]
MDTDLSDLSNLPSFAIGSTLPDGSGAVVQIDINQDNIFDLRLPAKFYPAGTIIEGDISMNQEIPWDLPPEDEGDIPEDQLPPNSNFPDIQGTVLHELGHVEGLAHCYMVEPTMSGTPILPSTNPYDVRELDFDDKLALHLAYTSSPLTRLGKGGIQGRIINGDAADNVSSTPLPIPEIENTPVWLGRPNDDGSYNSDDVVGVDETTSFTHKIRLFAEVMNSPNFKRPLNMGDPFAGAAIVRDNRYSFGGLPPSSSPVFVNSNTVLPPNGYVLYVQPAPFLTNDEAQATFPPDSTLIPPEFYGGTTPYALIGIGDVADPNTPGDGYVQDNYLQFAYNMLGQYALRIAGSQYQLLENAMTPSQGYITYRITTADGHTSDVANFAPSLDLVTTGIVENDLDNYAQGTFVVGNAIVSTETLSLGHHRGDGLTSPTDMLVQTTIQNITTQPLQVGVRFLSKPVIYTDDYLSFEVNGKLYRQEEEWVKDRTQNPNREPMPSI